MGVKLKQKDGAWWLFINHNGLRKAKKIGSDKRVALDVKKKVEAKLALGDFSLDEQKAVPTFGEYAERWIATVVPALNKSGTLRNYRMTLNKHIMPVFGKMKISEINRFSIKEFLLDKTNQGYSASVVRNLKNIISGILGIAVDEETIETNPSYRLGKLKSKVEPKAIEPLSREELAHLLDAFKKYYPQDYPMALTLARTGMRFGELLGLKWGDIDFHGSFINIQRSLSKSRIEETPKSGKSRRVDMSKQLCEVLKDLLKQRKRQTLKAGWRELPEFVFINTQGKPLDDSHWRERTFEKALAKAGMRRIKVHTLRHTYASLLIQNGESLFYVQKQLGHSSISITCDTYGHLSPQGNHDAVNRLDDNATQTQVKNNRLETY